MGFWLAATYWQYRVYIGWSCFCLLAATTVMGIPGWRVSFHLVAAISVVVGILVRLFAMDPRFANGPMPTLENNQIKGVSPFWSDFKALILEAKKVMAIHTFQVIVTQGVVGSFPWSALSFVTMWLELIRFSHQKTAFFFVIFVVGGSLGGLFGGRMGDILFRYLPNAGRIILAQISSGLTIPLAAVLLLILPDDPSTSVAHGLMFFIIGFTISWNGPATNNPIFAEIVPQKSRASTYALDRSFESLLSSFAPPLVGILSQHVYGYKPIPQGASKADEIQTDRENAASLAEALCTSITIPMALCCFIYTLLYPTYRRDRDRAWLVWNLSWNWRWHISELALQIHLIIVVFKLMCKMMTMRRDCLPQR